MPDDTPDHPFEVWPDADPSLGWLSEERRWIARPVAACFGLLPLALYWITACRGTGWLDASMIANMVHLLKTSSWVNNHNLFVYLARLWTELVPIADPAYSLNLLAGLLGAITVALVFRTTLWLTGNLAASAFGGVALMLSHSLWWHSTMVEVYTLNTALMAGMLHLIVRYSRGRSLFDLYGALLCWGLGISNHVLMGLFLFAFLSLFTLRGLREQLWRPGVIAGGMLVVALGGQLWLTKGFDDYARTLNNQAPTVEERTPELRTGVLSYTAKRALGGKFQDRMFTEDMPAATRWRWRANYGFLLLLNYPSLAFAAGWVGLLTWARRRRDRVPLVFFVVGAAAQVLWSSNYFIWDMYAFGLPVWVLFAVPVGLGFDRGLRAGRRPRVALGLLVPTLLIGPWLHTAVPRWAEEPGFWRTYFSSMAARNLYDPAEYFGNPNKRTYTRTEDVLAAYDRTLPPGSHIWDSDSKGYYPYRMYHQRVLGYRRDVSSHLVFGGFMDTQKASALASELHGHLQSDAPVFVSSLTQPERALLNQLYVALDPSAPLARVRALPPRQLAEQFPGWRLEKVPLDGLDDAWIYQFVAR
jgi:hypothetical protein